MKTPMQEMLSELKLVRQMCDDPSMEMDIWHTMDVLIEKAILLCSKEKDVIIDAFDCGGDADYFDISKVAEDYYKKKFNIED